MATVLLVTLSLVLAAIIFMWAKGFVKEQIEKNGQAAEYACANSQKIAFDANFVATSSTASGLTGTLQVVNRGSLPIYGFDIKQVSGGTVIRKSFAFSVLPGETIPSKNIVLVGDPSSLEIFPILLGSAKNQQLNKQYTCLHNAKKIQLN